MKNLFEIEVKNGQIYDPGNNEAHILVSQS